MKCDAGRQGSVPGRKTGFTLIELLIVIGIISILTVLAVPMFVDYVRRGDIQEATTCMSQWRWNMTQYFQDNRNYDTHPACGTDVCAGTFDVRLTCLTPDTYLLEATGHGAVNGFSFSVDQDDARTSDIPVWGISAEPCWISKEGGTC